MEPHPLLSHNQVTINPEGRNLTNPNNATINTYGSLMTNADVRDLSCDILCLSTLTNDL
jgi:hypothetical protein